MISKPLLKKQNLSLFFVCFGLMGGLWIFSILIFSEQFPDAAVLRPCWHSVASVDQFMRNPGQM
jgi:hypothetical protein